ncbi:DUF4398 domain-containing protein [Allohahella marinimesophila]|uniref:DUF4398 domain-containing protein n=1 Tax=Allohahella marinimesophila TaxID=1054972 RepID=A0ABP7NJ72_9GAMM
MKRTIISRWLTVGLCVGVLGACASAPKPDRQLVLAESRISEAKNNEAYQYAPVEIKNAEQHLTAARQALAKEDNLEARRLLEKAEMEADYAVAKSELAREDKTVQEVRAAIKDLKREINANSGGASE